ncbi:hypothetical protein K431DRAFT_282020 [Polychaeton citri CBS 116435]|uniref:Uncharacterized protein n=1 Tax=Polychaeton citri CBS 116435 TaxID=1314669 RepID=A0A9P4UTY1_9PEZI|nr:hypothetical protein K431DRAFT_282020 [Polychaeton citri CBS 116435]
MEDGVDPTHNGSKERPNLLNHESDGNALSTNESISATDGKAMKFPLNSSGPTPPQSPTSPPTSPKSKSHRRSFSNGILGGLSFLHTSNYMDGFRSTGQSTARGDTGLTTPPKSRKSEDEPVPTSPPSPPRDSAMAAALKQQKNRKRKGSLRKTALLGGRIGRERKGSLNSRGPASKQQQQQLSIPSDRIEPVLGSVVAPTPTSPTLADSAKNIRQQFSYESSIGPDTPSSSSSTWSAEPTTTSARLSLLTGVSATKPPSDGKDNLSSPLDVKSPVSQTSATSYTSTTDEDEGLVFERQSTNSQLIASDPPIPKPLSSSATSYFPSTIPRKHSSNKRSPLSRAVPLTPSPYSPIPDPHDYTDTSYWGWIILVVTWITFTVGMGSCLEVWSWAWDVGETPYAPPELEDDPTLPIVGYYPALIVLTGVVAWVWVTVAWVGMKYFRHAKIEV